MFLLLSEPSRALLELGFAVPFNNLFHRKQRGDGHPVLVLPGFLSTETSTAVLRKFIEKQGYDVYDWGLGRNLGKLEYMEALLALVDEIYLKRRQPLSLIGWSLGGVFAREIAKERPNTIRQVITLASPFAGLTEPNNIAWVYSLMTGKKRAKHVVNGFLEDFPQPAPVPSTAIYSKSDGVVPWEMCMELEEDESHQNIEVHSSHIGMGVNFAVLSVIANRLAQKKGAWQRLRPDSGLFKNKLVYPSLRG